MIRDLTDFLFHPDAFFARKNEDPSSFLVPLLIVGSGSLISLITPYLMTAFSSHTLVIDVLVPLPMAVWGLIAPFIAWFLISLGLFGICRAFSGTGTFPVTLRSAGYGMLPLTLISIMGLVTSPLLSPEFYVMLSLPFIMSLIYGVVIIAVLFVIWSGYLWMHAMEKVHAVSHGEAFAAAAVIGVIYVSWVFLGGLFMLFILMAAHSR